MQRASAVRCGMDSLDLAIVNAHRTPIEAFKARLRGSGAALCRPLPPPGALACAPPAGFPTLSCSRNNAGVAAIKGLTPHHRPPAAAAAARTTALTGKLVHRLLSRCLTARSRDWKLTICRLDGSSFTESTRACRMEWRQNQPSHRSAPTALDADRQTHTCTLAVVLMNRHTERSRQVPELLGQQSGELIQHATRAGPQATEVRAVSNRRTRWL